MDASNKNLTAKWRVGRNVYESKKRVLQER
jgi:hypothetical protein